MRPPSKDPATRGQAPHQGLFQDDEPFHLASSPGDLPPIWESVAQGRGEMDGLATLNQALMRGLPSCRQIFGGRTHFSASLPLLAFVKTHAC